MKEYDVYELHKKIVGKATEEEAGDISLRLVDDDRVLHLREKEGYVRPLTEILQKQKGFRNKIIEKVAKTYTFQDWKKEAIKELSLYLNNYYQSVKTDKALFHEFENILKNHYETVSKSRVYAYIKYFIIDGMLIKKDKNLYEIKKNNLIPKVKEEKELGILDELGM